MGFAKDFNSDNILIIITRFAIDLDFDNNDNTFIILKVFNKMLLNDVDFNKS